MKLLPCPFCGKAPYQVDWVSVAPVERGLGLAQP